MVHCGVGGCRGVMLMTVRLVLVTQVARMVVPVMADLASWEVDSLASVLVVRIPIPCWTQSLRVRSSRTAVLEST